MLLIKALGLVPPYPSLNTLGNPQFPQNKSKAPVLIQIGSYPPLCFAGERVPLVVAGGAGDDLVSVLVHRPRRRSCQLNYI